MKKWFCLLSALAFMAAFSSSAVASQSPASRVTINGRILTDFGWWQRSKELTNNQQDDVTSSFVNVPGHSYLRARWRTSDARTGGMVELGLKSQQPDATVKLRYAYGWYKTGNLRILAGQTDNWFGTLAYSPKQYVGSNNDNHLLLLGWGYLWPHRVTQVQLTYEVENWGIQFALEDPRMKAAPEGADFYTTVPRATLTGKFKAGGFVTQPGFLFVQHNYEGAPSGEDDSYDTWAFVLPMMYSHGGLTLKFQFHYGVNLYREIPYYPALSEPVMKQDGEFEDTTTIGGTLSAEYKIGKFTLIGGFGMERFANDEWQGSLGWKEEDTTRLAYFVAVPYQVNRYFGIHPEFSYYDYGDDPETGDDAGNEWMLGMQFRFIF